LLVFFAILLQLNKTLLLQSEAERAAVGEIK
jgi:hypothetical protein